MHGRVFQRAIEMRDFGVFWFVNKPNVVLVLGTTSSIESAGSGAFSRSARVFL
jgi:hypothetical protein